MSATLKRFCVCGIAAAMLCSSAWAAEIRLIPVSSTDPNAVIDVSNPLDTVISMQQGNSALVEVRTASWGTDTLRTIQVDMDTTGLASGTAGALTVGIDPAAVAAGLGPICPANAADLDGGYIDQCRKRCSGDPQGQPCDSGDFVDPCGTGSFADCLVLGFDDFIGLMPGYSVAGAVTNPNTLVVVVTSASNSGALDDAEEHYVASFVFFADATAEGTFTLIQFTDGQVGSDNGGSFSRNPASGIAGGFDVLGQVSITIVPPCTGDADCDNGLFCDGAETCDIATGICQPGAPVNCDDGVACTDDSCDNATAACINATNNANCDDGVGCTTDVCDAVTGCSNTPDNAVCDDGNGCTDNVCDPALDCQNPNNSAPCDDGVFCNGPDTCGGGTCSVHSGDPCPNTECNTCQEGTASCFDPSGTACGDSTTGECDNADSCDGAGTCSPNFVGAGAPCGDPTSGVCDGADSCDGNGACANNNVGNGTACNDGSGPGQCFGGTCLTGATDQLCLQVRGCGGASGGPCGTPGIDADCLVPGQVCVDSAPGGGPTAGICVDQCCYDDAAVIEVDVELSPTTSPACGAQIFLAWDTTALDFISAVSDPDGELGMPLELVNIAGPGTLDLAIGIPLATECAAVCGGPGGGTCNGGTIVRLTFMSVDACKTPGVWLRNNNPCSVVAGASGGLTISTCNGGDLCPADKGVMGDATDPINVNLSVPTWNCPDDSIGNADCGTTTRTATWDALTVTDSCDEGLVGSCTVTYFAACDADRDCGLGIVCSGPGDAVCGAGNECVPGDPDDPNPNQPHFCTVDNCGTNLAGFCDTAGNLADTGLTEAEVLAGGGDFPPGHYDISCTATNSCGSTGTCDVVVENSGDNTVCIDVELSPTMAPGSAADSIMRCIDFELSECGAFACPNGDPCDPQNPNACGGGPEQLCQAVTISRQAMVTFGLPGNAPGHGSVCFEDVPPGNWDCITAMDQKHSLSASCFLGCDGDRFVASFKGTPEQSPTCHWLVQGNLDGNDHIDIVDFTLLANDYLTAAPDGNDSLCGTAGTDADINGDGVVTLADYTFIIVNFFDQDKDPCAVICNPEAQAPRSNPLNEISVRELQAAGMGREARAADLNGDGMINVKDMVELINISQDDPDAPLLLEAVSNRLSGAGLR